MKSIFGLGLILAQSMIPFEVSAEYLAPDYEVALKKGTVFHVADFKVEGASISLFFNGDMRRVAKKAVGSIRPLFKEVEGVNTTTRSLAFSRKSELRDSSLAAEMEGREALEEEGAARFLREEVKQAMEAKHAAIGEFRKSIRSGDKNEGARIREGILELQERIAVLLDEAKEEGDGALPSWWEEVSKDPVPGE